MPSTSEIQALKGRLRDSERGARFALMRLEPARLLLLGYLSYIAIGWGLLSLPAAQEQAVGTLDALFIAASAVTTTGLVTLDPAVHFTLMGEIVILALFQVGGLGYMSVSSFAVLALQHRLSQMRESTVKASFGLPEGISPRLFLRSVILFTLVVEALGALALWAMFEAEGVERPVWTAIFHAVSAFCTAGFSLFPDSLAGFSGHFGITAVIATLSILGAVGFLVVVDSWRNATGRARHLGFTSKVIVRVTLAFLIGGTILFAATEPSIAGLEPGERVLVAFFQVMSASTTVGFSTHPTGELGAAILLLLVVLMAIGASPAGTGGGLKTTTFAVLVGLVRSMQRGRGAVEFAERRIQGEKVNIAAATLGYYLGLLTTALFLLYITEMPAAQAREIAPAFEAVLFEAVSALGTVGLSTGLTPELSDFGKVVIITLMLVGRLGILTFGIAIATPDETPEEARDNDIAM